MSFKQIWENPGKRRIVLTAVLVLVVLFGAVVLKVASSGTAQQTEKKTSADVSSVKQPEVQVQSPDSYTGEDSEVSGQSEAPVKVPMFGAVETSVEKEKRTATVEVNDSNVQKIDTPDALPKIEKNRRSTWEVRTALKTGTTGALLAEGQGKGVILWQPMTVSGEISTVRIPDAKLSPDRSVIAFAETTGSVSGPFGSRIVLMSTNTWTVLKIVDIPKRNVIRFEWIPGSTQIAALCRKQKEMKQPYGVAVFDLSDGSEKGFVHVEDDSGLSGFVADAHGHLILSHSSKPELIVLNSGDLSADIVTIPAAAPNCALAISMSGKEFAFAPGDGTGNQIEIYKTGDLRALSTVAMPKGFPLQELHFMHNPKNFLLCGSSGHGEEACLILAGNFRKLPGWSSGKGLVSPDGKTVYNLLNDGNQVSLVDAKTGNEIHVIKTDRVQPRLNERNSKIEMIFLFPESEAFGILDNRGSFSLIKSENRKHGYHDERAIIFQRSKNDR